MVDIPLNLTKKDFESEQEIRWCPGCGDYAILASLQRVLPEMNIPRENIAFISGIGCSSRFPYYMNTYGFHTIHGRAPTIATGLKIMRPELTVFVVTGDGDALSIGANHLLHLIRRNVDITILLLNNRIYGLTKGQTSPTSEQGKITKSSPLGSLDAPIDPLKFALTANSSFLARVIDVDAQGLQHVIQKAVEHKGTSLIEIYQNCNIFNDGAFEAIHNKAQRAANTVFVEPGKPMLFGEQDNKVICWEYGQYVVKALTDNNQIPESAILKPNATNGELLSLLESNQIDFPVVTGILRMQSRPTLDSAMAAQVASAKAKKPYENLASLLTDADTWQHSKITS